MCVKGTAEVMFRRADWMNGLEEWIRLVRDIDHGQAIRLETLRRQVQDLHTKPIKSLEDIEEGVASFENIMAEYVKAGGPQAPDWQMKADFLRVLPKEIRELPSGTPPIRAFLSRASATRSSTRPRRLS